MHPYFAISVPARSNKQSVHQAVLEPYCILPIKPFTQREQDMARHTITEREAYPLAFNPSI